MKGKLHFLLILFFFSFTPFCFAQNKAADSLAYLLEKAATDTAKVNLLNRFSEQYRTSDIDKANEYANRAVALADKAGYLKGKAVALNNIAAIYRGQSNYNKSIEINQQVLKIYEAIGDKREIARSLNDIGAAYFGQASFSNALAYFLKTLKIREELNDTTLDGKRYVAQSYNNIGIIYYKLNDFDKSLEFYLQTLKLREETRDSSRMADCLNNIGIVYQSKNDYPKALEYYQQSLKIRENLNDKRGIANSLNNLGDFYREQEQYSKALDYYLKSLKIKEERGDKNGITISLNNIGMMYVEQGRYDNALEYSNKSLEMAKEIGSKDDIKNAYETLADIYAKKGNYDKAYEMHKLFSSIKDSIYNAETAGQLAEMQTRFETEKKDKEIQLLNKDKEVQNAKLTRQKVINYSVMVGLAMVIMLAFLVYNRYRIKQKANQKLEAAYKEIADKNKDITDSIQYAKRIQEAILPAKEKILRIFPHSFVFYKPRDIVSGDFYWFAQQKNNGDNPHPESNKVVLAVADCTGHGVPGAFMSMIGNTSLNQIVNEKEITEPALILEHLNLTIREALKQDEEMSESRDGMDVAICTIDFDNKELQFAGAYRPLYFFRNNSLMEVSGDKFPVAGFHLHRQRRFSNSKLQFGKGDSFYIFTDGYADQFGGEHNRKFMTKRFKDLLINIHQFPMNEQEEKLAESYEQWKGDHPQMDDILVIGVRF